MKKFKNLDEVIKYCDYCPICRGKIVGSFLPENGRLKISSQYSSITIDCKNLSIIDYNFSSPMTNIRDLSGNIYCERAIDGQISYNKESVIIENCFYCDVCHKYSGCLEFVFDTKSLVEILLKTEYFYGFNEESYNIYNLYSLNKTQIVFTKQNKTIEIPLISQDLKNISDVINRIEKLIIFA